LSLKIWKQDDCPRPVPIFASTNLTLGPRFEGLPYIQMQPYV
jgi:hypothetical protein